MWTIRQEQTEAFRQHHLQKFEDEMVEHLKKFAPQLCKAAGDNGVRQVIRLGMDNARTYGLTNRGPVRFYIELMFAFGSFFDTDPQYPWARAALGNQQTTDQTDRAEQLWAQSREYFTKVFGPRHEHMNAALQRLKDTPIDSVTRSEPSLLEGILHVLPDIHPQKYDYLGDAVFRRLVEKAFALADSYGLTTSRGRTTVVGLTFAIGHRFVDDPLWAWTRKRMTDSRFPDPDTRAQQLYSAAMTYLDHAMPKGDGA